ncbi:Trp biosynthesis-associated membrane protein [Pseudonocardia bannensis]|uniref:Trp biosynthesis-associated membrane protein n=1 Tax=Pseudonocardia bannensis TaxID=630973 RepID=A0A848DJZ2_9PSEU|nr:Trp biosynthesis-associated membrane protein [Pseudonocardia bannensis]NMH92791.1 Trp biosynthesis-associated membrane protein [Pseudonocardia bannensis]
MSAAGDGRRRLLLICVGLLAGALALWGSSRLTWFSATVVTATRGEVELAATGADLEPAPAGIALLAVAAVAAAIAVSGIARRALGGVIVLAGAAAGAITLTGLLSPPPVERLAVLLDVSLGSDPAATLPSVPVGVTPAPWLGVVGSVLLLAAGAALLVGERGLPRFGGRYAAPGARRPAVDPDRAAWQELDAGRDPTVDVADGAQTQAGPGGDPSTRRV